MQAALTARAAPLPLLLLMLASGIASAVLGADRGWDAQNYHVWTPWQVIVPRPQDVLPAGLQGFHNPVADLPFAWLLRVANDRPWLVAFLMGLPAGVALWVLWLCARRVLAGAPDGAALALLALLGAAGGAVWRSQVGTTSGDVATGALVLAGVLALLAPGRGAFAAGLAVGAAIGLKLTNAPFAIAIAAMVVAVMGWHRRLPGALLLCAAGGVLGMVATGGWWAARLFAETGNPVFPYFHHLFDAAPGAPRAGRDLQFMPAGVLDALARPFLWAVDHAPRVTEERMRDPRIAAGLVAAIALLALPARGPAMAAARPLAVFFLVAYAVWLPLFSIYRYIAVLEMLAPLLLVAALGALPRRLALGGAAAFAVLAFPLTKPVPALRGVLEDRYLALDWPALAPGAVVLGTEKPTAFVAPGLPPEVALWSLAGLAEVGGPRERAALAALVAGDAPLYAVAPGDGRGLAMLAGHGLAAATQGCRRICTNWSPAGAGPLVCPVTRAARAEAPPPLRHPGPARRLCEAAGPGFTSAGRRGLALAGEALVDFGAGCTAGALRLAGGAIEGAEAMADGRLRVLPGPDGVARLRGTAVVAAAACLDARQAGR
jgi:hypothetical protein